MSRLRLLLGINILWFAFSVVSDGLTSLALPARLQSITDPSRQASLLGVLSFIGLGVGMLVQPLAGAWSDTTRQRWGRRVPLALGVGVTLVALGAFTVSPGWAAVAATFLLVQVGLNLAQAAQQGFLPDLTPATLRGRAAGIKGFMDMAGAMLGFVLLGEFLGRGQILPAAAIMAVLLVAGLLLTVWLVKEKTDGSVTALPRLDLAHIFLLETGSSKAFKRLVLARFFFLLGTYAVGRFLLYYVGDRLGLAPEQAAEQAGGLLAGLALATVAAAPLGGWLSDRWGRIPLMVAGGLLSAVGVLGLMGASSGTGILGFGLLMSLGSGAFAVANWAATADLAPEHQGGRYFGLANLGAGGAAAAAGLFGPLMDAGDRLVPGGRYTILFGGAALAFGLSCMAAWAVNGKNMIIDTAAPVFVPSTTSVDSASVKGHDYIREDT